MAGLLDFLSANSGGGLLSGLMYPSPLLQRAEQPMPDTMAGLFQQEPPSPFGPTPQIGPFVPPPAPPLPQSPFNQGVAPVPFGLSQSAAQPAPALPPPQNVGPLPQPQQEPQPQNTVNIGGYQMPRVGDAGQFVPQAPTDVSAQSRQPAMMPAQAQQQPPQALPPAFGGGSALGRAFNPDGLIARLTGNDSRSIARQNLKAQYDALVPLVGPQKAMLAVMNPEAGKLVLEQALGSKQKFTEIGVDSSGTKQYGFVNERNQSVIPYGAPGSDVPLQMAGPDGRIIQMPQGADPKTWRNELTRINADVAAGKKTEVQAKAEIFGNKMELANKSITDDVGTSLAGKIASGIPLGNYAQSAEYQKYKQASSNFITAMLRQESGAAIGPAEFQRYDREYMPQPGDSREVLAQKAEARRVAIEGMKKGAGPSYKSPSSTLPQGWSVSVR